MKIAVTGASGFIGRALVAHLEDTGHGVVKISRSDLSEPDFSGIEVIIHCAGIAHRSGKQAPHFTAMNAVNHLLTVSLAEKAREAGVRRFIFVSTINVIAGHPSPLTVDISYHPLSDYGRAKALAEQSLLKMQGIEIVIARPALTYGSGAPGNLQLLLKLCDSGLPLPFGCADNKRSCVSLSNVVRALAFMALTESTAVSGTIFHLADPVPLSTKKLVTMFRQLMNRPRKMVPIPRFLMKAGLRLLGKKAIYEQLYENMIIDGHDIQTAGFSYSDGLPDISAMVDAFVKKKAG